jgi:hypothetical protein
MQITKATLLKGRGADQVLLDTDLPNGCWPYNGTQDVRFSVAAGSGDEYLKAHFPDVPVVIVDIC